ncbi:MAG: XkdF-like putative serine protease domain-containing protein [Candidatus Heimdallarchaeaceae archaeon]
MPIQNCYENNKPGYRWGEAGKCYTYTPGNEASRKNAKRKAILQGVAIEGGSIKETIKEFAKDEKENIDMEFVAKNFNDEQNIVFGWAYIAQDEKGNQLVDHSGETVLKEDFYDFENGIYAFNLAFRESGFMHLGKAKGFLVESMVFSKEKMDALNIPEGTLPHGAWVGFFFPNDEDYNFIKSMKSPMFSIQGSAIKQEIDESLLKDGLGRMGGDAKGPGGLCVCPKCGYKMTHETGEPCYDITCPKCGAKMDRE